MNADLVDKIRVCPNLPSLPAIAVQVLDLAQRPSIDIAEIARIISKDPALSGKILKTVNSSFYGRSHAISTINHALVVLGLQSVKTLVLTFSLVTNLSNVSGKGFKHLSYWKRSIYAATAARTIAIKFSLVQQEESFLATLLADIGMLVLETVLGDEYGQVCAKAATHQELVKAELDALGMTHADVGAMLAEQWKLPPVLAGPIAHSHDPEAMADPALHRLAEVVQLAGFCGDVFVDKEAAGAIQTVRKNCAARHQMSEADCDLLLSDISERTKEVAGLFEINIGAYGNYEAILQKANERLVELTLQTQQQATELAAQNQQLKEQATTDGLTSLANRARFDGFLRDNFAAVAQGKPLSLLMLDLDKFKSINDKYGHQIGDAAIKAVATMLKSAARKQDLAARYGGEEMTLVLPDTPRATAALIADTIRRTVAAKPIKSANGLIPVTVSIGVATAEPGGPLANPALLIKAADMAVYAAKRGGRNCVKVFSLRAAAA
jgi:two-component system, cell cycle response regulator